MGIAPARGKGAVGRSIGAGAELVDVAPVAFGVFSGCGVASVFSFAVLFFLAVAPFFAVDFFFVDFDFAVGLGDFFGLADADISGVSLGFGDDSWPSDVFSFTVFAFAAEPGDSFGLGDELGSGVSAGFGFAFAFGVGEGVALLLAFFFFGDGVGEVSVSRVLRNCSRLRSSSLSCALRYAPTMAPREKMTASQMRKRGTPERNRPRDGFKQPAWPTPLQAFELVHVRGAKSHSTCRREAGTDK